MMDRICILDKLPTLLLWDSIIHQFVELKDICRLQFACSKHQFIGISVCKQLIYLHEIYLLITDF